MHNENKTLIKFECENKDCPIKVLIQVYDDIINKRRNCPCCLYPMKKIKIGLYYAVFKWSDT